MAEDYFVKYCAPTLAGLKIANLFNYQYKSLEELESSVAYWNKSLNKKGIFLKVLNVSKCSALIYVYRKALLQNKLKEECAIELLESYGYFDEDLDILLEQLSSRVRNAKTFPHEIGIFLGYPINDIKDFIKHKGANSKLIGYWKVYNNVEGAIEVFEKFKKCSDVYLRKYEEGIKLHKLIVEL